MASWKNIINRGQQNGATASNIKNSPQMAKPHTHNFERRNWIRLEELTQRRRRSPFLHWGAFVLALVSLGFLIAWLFNPAEPAPFSWKVLDAVLGLVFIFEFFSRDGFRWNPIGYTFTRFFDFIAIVPVFWLTNQGFPGEAIWVWLILISRAARALDRLLGDGFVRRNLFALYEGLEEEITDRVLIRIMARIQEDLQRGKFGEGIAKVLESNKPSVLETIAKQHPANEGFVKLVGLDGFLRRTEENTYDALVNILNSDQVDKAIRESVDSVFDKMREEIGARTWLEHIGFRGGPSGPHEHNQS